jgi:flagellin-like protein
MWNLPHIKGSDLRCSEDRTVARRDNYPRARAWIDANRTDDRGVTPVVGTILVVAIVVILAAFVGATALAYTDLLKDPAPKVGTVEAELVPNVVGDPDDQTVEFTNVTSDRIETKDLEVVVDATDACGKRTRLLDPTVLSEPFEPGIEPDDYTGDDILDEQGLNGVFGTGSSTRRHRP